ncbi:MAG: amidohydrolase [Chloroflexi bacterium]|nr:amidohydrolase [Chloroflexota bacterium]MCL5110940.1 amidohydrolase [Chloroflexota bacterium]
MKAVADLKRDVCAVIDARADSLRGVAEEVLHHPELGFKEHATAALVSARFRELGLAHRTGLAITGVKAVLDTGRPGPTVAVFGELDSILVRGHACADAVTGAAHACGHNAQIATLLGVASALAETDVLSSLSGRVALIAVPAEEYVEIEYRLGLREKGMIEFLGGKPELIRLGELDDVDMAMMVHTTTNPEEGRASIPPSLNGCLAKFIQFTGRAAHAGGMPHKGINALNAAMLALSAIHAQRETFRDEDTVRVHPIITKGGELVNVVPADVKMETFVRGKTVAAMLDAERKVDRALRAGALAVGAKLRITTLAGYLPYETDPAFAELYRANALSLVGESGWGQAHHHTGSSDMGDISQIMPAVQPSAGGATGASHGADFTIVDLETAVQVPAKAMAMTLVDLLADDAANARRVLAETKPKMSKAEYLAMMRRMTREALYEEA